MNILITKFCFWKGKKNILVRTFFCLMKKKILITSIGGHFSHDLIRSLKYDKSVYIVGTDINFTNNSYFIDKFLKHDIHTNEKLKVINSTMGRKPPKAAPTPRPANPCSVMGVSIIRFSPNSSKSPWEIL